ncbi:hypothetical protein VTK73DRAFT_6397 [Phialemonium thermophilum]|uniref:DUF1763-domain-containing protein n=1 Tax=Phialemonium thermophilum TaxID=223376 RepID=A0ABR3XVH8_9PEZI
MTDLEIIHAYRHLLRAGLRAIQFSKPARFALRNQLRTGFREKGAQLDPDCVRRTVSFLQAAEAERGLEHRIVKNLLHVAWARERETRKSWKAQLVLRSAKKANMPDPIKSTAYKHYDMTVSMLNHTMGLCLR